MASDLVQFAFVLAALVLAFMLMAHAMFGTNEMMWKLITCWAAKTLGKTKIIEMQNFPSLFQILGQLVRRQHAQRQRLLAMAGEEIKQ